ncbi:hypothetical protein H1R20_g6783, partial [Candolleomyces eurysporus]
MLSVSPFAQHLHTNYAPSHSELNPLRSLVDERQKLVDALEREIEELAKRRDEHAKFVKEHSALLSPIRRVPNDILSLIFLACLPHNLSPQRLTELSAAHPALVVSHVCQRWRQLSLSTPLLWTFIDIHIPRLPDPRDYQVDHIMVRWGAQMQAIYEMAQFWISRSTSCPLTVAFSGGLSFPHYANFAEEIVFTARQRMSSIVDVICDVSDRWKSVYLSLEMGNDDPAVARFFQIPSEDIPILENLYTNLFTELSQEERVLDMTMGGELVKAPSLRRLAVGRLRLSPLSLPINWANITEISLGAPAYQPDPSFPLSLLSVCFNLTRCSLDFRATHQALPDLSIAPSSNWGMCLLPRLRTLEVRGSEPPVWFASYLDLPSLQELILLCPSRHPVKDFEEGDSGAIELIRRFGDCLTDVTIDSWCLNESRLTHVLEQLPNVVSLRLVGALRFQPQIHARILDSVLDSLTPKYDDGEDGKNSGVRVHLGNGFRRAFCCPKLEKFGYRFNHSVGFSEEALIRFIASRRGSTKSGPGLRPNVQRLNSVVVSYPTRKPNKTIREVLEEMDNVDLQDMILITTYDTPVRQWVVSRMTEDEPKFGSCGYNDYLSIVGQLGPTLGGWVL